MAGAQARLRFGRTRLRVLLEQAVRVLAPPGALPDQRHLSRALDDHHRLDRGAERRDGCAGDLAQRRPLVAEDSRVAVLVGADRPLDSHVAQHAAQDQHRMLGAGVFRVRLDALELRLCTRPVDFELRHENRRLTRRALYEHDRPFCRQEVEAGEVLDVLLVEEHVAVELVRLRVLQQTLSTCAQLVRRDASQRHPAGR